jgi:hypothetical protein
MPIRPSFKSACNSSYQAQWIDPQSGQVLPGNQQVNGGNATEIKTLMAGRPFYGLPVTK